MEEIEWIYQLNSETQPLFDAIVEISGDGMPTNMSVLYDASCGLGVEADVYQKPLVIRGQEIPSGYAGGMGAHNIDTILDRVARSSANKPVWIDMESSLRSTVAEDKYTKGGDNFSLDKCFKCVLVGARFMPQSTARISLLSI